MADLINTLFVWIASTDYAQYASLLAFIAFVITHTLPFLPVSVTEKIPDAVMKVLSALAGKYKNAELTDSAGNKK